MDYAVSFGRHFARLVWMLRHDKAAVDDPTATLGVLVTHTNEAAVRLGVDDNQIVANGTLVPSALPGVSELAARLSAERISSITCDRDAKPSDILGVARLLADPEAGGGESLADAIEALDARTVRVTSAATSHDGKQRAFTEGIPIAPLGLLALLDESAVSPTRVARVLETLVNRINEEFRKGDFESAADLLHALIQRETKADRIAAPGYASALTQLFTPLLLQGIASLLPRHRDREAHYLAIFVRARDQGADAVIAQLGAAQSIVERRIYFDALRSNEFGVPSLTRMLGDTRWYLVRNAADLLGLLKAAPAEPALLRALNHEDERVRRSAALALARLGTSTAARGVYQALKVASSAVRHSAATALLTGGGERMALTLVEALEHENDQDTQIAILMALGRIATAAAVDRLAQAARPERGLIKPVAVRVAATEALAAAGTPTARSALRALRRDKERDVSGAAFWGLGAAEEGSGSE